jgi:hypothetical protein
MLSVTYAECHIKAFYAGCQFAETHYAECHVAVERTCQEHNAPAYFGATISFKRKQVLKPRHQLEQAFRQSLRKSPPGKNIRKNTYDNLKKKL